MYKLYLINKYKQDKKYYFKYLHLVNCILITTSKLAKRDLLIYPLGIVQQLHT